MLQRIRDLIEQGADVRRGARGSAADDGLHDAHAGAGRARRVPVQPGRDAPGRRVGHARRLPRRVPRARPLRQRQRAAVQHDGAGAAHRRRRQRRQPAARRGHARDVGADLAGRRRTSSGRCARSPTASTCRPGCRPSMAALFDDAPRRATGVERHDDPALWRARAGDSRTRSCGRARSALRSYLFTFIRERARQRWTDEHVSAAARRRRRDAARSQRADDRLRAPLHRLQAARADLPRPRAPGAHPQRARAGRCRSCSPARRIRPTRPASITCSRSTAARIDPMFGGRIAFVDDYDLHVAHFLVQGCDVWLNNPRKPLEASGTSGMKAAINGVPHLSIGDGWWAEGFTGDERLADRRPAATARSRRGRRGRRRGALPAARAARSCRRFYDRDAHGIPRRWLRDRQAGDPHGRAALQRAADGQGVRGRRCTRRPLRAGRSAGAVADGRSCGWHPSRRVGSMHQSMSRKTIDPDPVRAVRRQGSLRAARRGALLPRLLGQEDRRRGDRRARVRAQALHPRAQRREIPHLPLHAEAALRPADRRRRRLRPVPDDGALSRASAGTSRPTTSKGIPKGARSPRSWSTSSRPRSSSRGAAASGTWRSSGPSSPEPEDWNGEM